MFRDLDTRKTAVAAEETVSPDFGILIGSSDVSQTVWIRPIAFVASILFLVSWVFPVAAGLVKDTSAFPKWWGPVDVGLSLLLAIVAIGIQALVRGTVDQRAEDKDIIYRDLSRLQDRNTRDHGGGDFCDSGRRSNRVGALRDRFHVAHLAGLVYSALVAGRNTLSRDHPRLIAGDRQCGAEADRSTRRTPLL